MHDLQAVGNHVVVDRLGPDPKDTQYVVRMPDNTGIVLSKGSEVFEEIGVGMIAYLKPGAAYEMGELYVIEDCDIFAVRPSEDE